MFARIILVIFCSFPALAPAQTNTEPAPTVAEKVTTYDFELDSVTGTRALPLEALHQSLRQTSAESLVEVRTDFRDRMLADAEDL